PDPQLSSRPDEPATTQQAPDSRNAKAGPACPVMTAADRSGLLLQRKFRIGNPSGNAGFALSIGGRTAIWQRYEDATICQRRPADPTDPGDAADLSIMGYLRCGKRMRGPCRPPCPLPVSPTDTVAQRRC